MADVTVGNATDLGNNGGSTNTLTHSHNNNGDTVVVVFNGDNFGGADDISSVTYAGASCTLRKKITSATGGDRLTYIYDLIGTAAAGVNNVVITAGSSHLLQGGAVSLSNVQATDATGNATNFSGTTDTSLTTNFTTTTDRCLAVLVEGCYNGGNPPGAGTGSTRQTFDGTNGGWGLFTSATLTPAGSQSMQTTRTSNPFGLAIVHVVVAYTPTGAAAGGPFPHYTRRRMLGGLQALG
jgi:hypothetical protein